MPSYVVLPFPGCGKQKSFGNVEDALIYYQSHEECSLLICIGNILPYRVIEQRF